jgi:hypothetical protein
MRREMTNSSFVKFYVDGILETTWTGTSGYNTYSTDVLPAGTYEFTWEVYRRNSYISYIWLDNLFFSD